MPSHNPGGMDVPPARTADGLDVQTASERELTKHAELASAMADALRGRGIP